jgi:acyl-[acyl-carrier-protein]-phospholipid O-acyltransferase/long-chain-fatty-acid--[acyl-carrier-protein] ligase
VADSSAAFAPPFAVPLADDFGWGWATLSAVGVVVALLVVLCIVRPYWPLRVLLWLLTHSVYWLRVLGGQNVPRKGAALLVSNHVSYVDWLLLMASQRRFIRFVVWAGWTKKRGLRWLLRWAGCIPIDGASGPRALIKSIKAARDALGRGELVCIFAEGRFTRTGIMLPFHRGFEQVVKNTTAPIIPVCLDQVWGSIFSLYGGRYFWKLPQEIPYHVTVAYGEPLPNDTPAADVRQAVQKLSADCTVARTPRRVPVHRQFVRRAGGLKAFRPCLTDSLSKGKFLTYGEALAGAMCLARALKPVLGDDALVALWLPPGVGGFLANVAVNLLGKATVNLNYTAGPDSVRSAIRQCGAKHVVTAKLFTHRVKLEPGEGVELVYLEDLMRQITKGQKLRAWLAVLLLPSFVLERWVLGLGRHTVDRLATVIFSSGSTGEPKGVMLTHGNIAANLESMIQAAGLTARDRLLGVLPFFHSFGYTVTLWGPLQVGASSVYHADPRQAKEIGELCRNYACTVHVSTATFLRFYLRKCGPEDFKTLRLLMCGAEKLPPATAEEFQKKFGVLPLEGYGCTELSPATAVNLPDVDLDHYKQIGNKPGTVGQPLPGVAARVVHPDTTQPLRVGEEGLLLIFGANVMKGYLGQPGLTAQVVRDGWYVTGDMAKIDADGFITLTGRLSRFAKVGGEMVPLERVEEELNNVLGAPEKVGAVTCVPDESRGERLVVLYEEKPLAELGYDVPRWQKELGGRGLPNLWVPGPRDFFPIPELPLLGSGKLDLKRLQDTAAELVRK